MIQRPQSLRRNPVNDGGRFSMAHHRFPVEIESAMVVQHRNPGPVPHVGIRRAVFIKIQAGLIRNMLPVCKMNIFSAGSNQSLIGRDDILFRDHHRVILGVSEPDGFGSNGGDVFI